MYFIVVNRDYYISLSDSLIVGKLGKNIRFLDMMFKVVLGKVGLFMAQNGLKPSISTLGIISLGSGGVIGSSWIYTNSQFFHQYGAGGEIFGLLAASVLAILVSLSFAELSTVYPKAGGEVVYGYKAFGKKGGMFAGWALLGSYLSALAFYVTASSMLLSQIIPQIATGPAYSFAGMKVHYTELALGVLITLFIFAINYRGASLTSNVQIVLFILLVIIGVVLVVVGFSHGKPSNFWPAFYDGQSKTPEIFRFILPAMTFLTGWESIGVMAEEVKTPARKIGRIVVIAIMIAAAYYLLVLLASAWIHPWQSTAKMEMGTIDAFKAEGFPLLGTAAFVISFLGLGTSFLALFSAAPRLIYSLAEQKILPQYFAKVHPKYGTPSRAIVMTLVLVLSLGWLGKGALTYFLDIGGFLTALAWGINAFNLWAIRRKYPELKGGFRNKHLWLPILGGVIAILIAVATLIPGTGVSLVWPYEYVILGIWVVIGLISYFAGRK
ncbi:APC family permease [Weissella paramesenteroides]|uniref:Amino acid permease n=3 Tax=Weissella paramesenteroides TaxID=1249 RepID=C5R9C6_WEIPA|nr:APC family permease [Weissella paramesenteroides]EER75358.1 amino acid permease [Weissella paramesenteroides ATCC 33313]